MRINNRFLVFLLAFLLCPLFLQACGNDGTSAADSSSVGSDSEDLLQGRPYTLLIEPFDWGPGVTKVIIPLDADMPELPDPSQVTVSVEKQSYAGKSKGNRTVTAVYFSDAKGNAVQADAVGGNVADGSNYFTVEMSVHPSDDLASPFFYSMATFMNTWADPYSCEITVTSADGGTLLYANQEAERLCPAGDVFAEKGGFDYKDETFGDIHLNYAFYNSAGAADKESTAADRGKNDDTAVVPPRPLIIWLHGAGEGGDDVQIAYLGNKVTALTQEKIQAYFTEEDAVGACVLVPQCPTMWMDSGSGQYTSEGTSKYLGALTALIRMFADDPRVDAERIYIGGCSNGGYMTMNLLIHEPDLFAAAFPICEAYDNRWISDEEIAILAQKPIWFTHAKTDTTVNPDNYTLATYHRLIEAGAENVHFSYFDKVVDTTGLYQNGSEPYEYFGHWSWIYTLNDACVSDYDGSPVMIDRGNGEEQAGLFAWLGTFSK